MERLNTLQQLINENAAWNTANHFNLFTPAQCPICGLDLLYFPDLDETFEQEANDRKRPLLN